MSAEDAKAIVRRYYEDLWNRWDFEVADQLIAPDVSFRGSLRVETRGLGGFLRYMTMVRNAFPDFHNAIEDLIAERDRVAARLTYTGTHRGDLFGIGPTGRRVTYAGIALFRIAGEKIVDVWVIGDALGCLRQLGRAPERGP